MVEEWVKQLTEGVIGGPPFKIGDIVQRPNGRVVKIIDGQYWGTHGLSNFWYWRKVLPNGKFGKKECGYGWRPKPEKVKR